MIIHGPQVNKKLSLESFENTASFSTTKTNFASVLMS